MSAEKKQAVLDAVKAKGLLALAADETDVDVCRILRWYGDDKEFAFRLDEARIDYGRRLAEDVEYHIGGCSE